MRLVYSILSLTLLLSCCAAIKVLLIPIPGYSHVRALLAIGKKLVENGNEVSFMVDTMSDKKFKPESRYGVKFVVYGEGSDKLEAIQKLSHEFFYKPMQGITPLAEDLTKGLWLFSTMLEQVLLVESEEVLAGLEQEKFDICVVDASLVLKMTILIPHRLGIPFITYTDALDPWLVRTPYLPSFYPNELLMFDPNFKLDAYSFYDRLKNTVASVFFKSVTLFRDCSEQTLQAYKRYGHFQDLDELISKSLLFFVPDDPVAQASLPRTPNIIHVGGLTTELFSPSALPLSLLSFMHISNNTIIVSFGSQITEYPTERYQVFIEAFKKLPQFQIIWKSKLDPLIPTPSNVIISEWIPQNDLLSHPSVKLFVTHSGNNGIYESIVHGVPLIAIPVQADQFRNTARVLSRGFGLSLSVATFTSQEFVDAVMQVTTKPRYKDSVRKASAIFKSAPLTPAQRAAYWTEHVSKYGNEHLRPAGNEMSIWEYLLLDVLLFVFVCASVLLVGFLVCVKHLVTFACKRMGGQHLKKNQ